MKTIWLIADEVRPPFLIFHNAPFKVYATLKTNEQNRQQIE